MELQTITFSIEDIKTVSPYTTYRNYTWKPAKNYASRAWSSGKKAVTSWRSKYKLPSQSNTTLWVLRDKAFLKPVRDKINRFNHVKIDGKSNQEVREYLLNELDKMYNRIEDKVGKGKQVGILNSKFVVTEIRTFTALCRSNKVEKMISNNMFYVVRGGTI